MKAFSIYVIAGPLLARRDDDDDRHGHGYGHKKDDQCESLVLDWSDWGPCTVSCEGVGLQLRARQIVQSQSCDSQEVPCPTAGGWGEWTQVGGCSVSCEDGGEKAERRLCDSPAPQNGGTCPGSSALEEWRTVSCSGTASCPGGWGEWERTASCPSVSCGTGMETFDRHCDSPAPYNGGAQCTDSDGNPALTETDTVECDLSPCPVEIFCWATQVRLGSLTAALGHGNNPVNTNACWQACYDTPGCRAAVVKRNRWCKFYTTSSMGDVSSEDLIADLIEAPFDFITGFRVDEFDNAECPPRSSPPYYAPFMGIPSA